MPPFRIQADHPDEKGVVHVGDVYVSAEEAENFIALAKRSAKDMNPQPSPGGPPAEERVTQDPLLHALAIGAKLSVVELVPSKKGKDDAGQEIVVESKWKKVG